ncbi:C40 family peptidase [Paludibacter sp.]|uniref:C40 family peptidase n=1 Tax=Paludibacter sp. TaxID=1898105 RepID=UPI0013521D7D|nr:C40 family peptidase [Paludibacter sp.]MTK52008.1 NlpC/P60 family protein [Paludibacter sp.]
MMKKNLISGLVCGLMLCLAVAQPVKGAEPAYGIAIQSLIDLRLAPSYAGEMGTQALMGTPLHVLEKGHGWVKVTTPEGYASWTTTSEIKLVDEKEMKAWNKAPKVIVTEYFTLLCKEASSTSGVVSDVVWGDLVKNMGEQNGYYKVQLPDGRMAFLKKESGEPFDQWLASRRPTAENIIATAKMFLGFPYVWGGASTKGVDCSGFTKTSFFLNGVVLLRDASQQATTGDPVDISKGYDNLKPGDLLFFGGKKVTHVGMYIGNGEFIHSAGMVHISSLRPEASNYDAWNAKRLLCARRIITQIDKDPNIVSLKNHPYYK